MLQRNPAADVCPLCPWPDDAFKRVLGTAPKWIRRAAFPGRATGQWRSDLVKFGRKNRRADGLQIKVGKLRDKDHFVPLKASELTEIDSWSCSDTGITNAAGQPMSEEALGSALDKFLAEVPELKGLNLNPHGLRAMAVCDRRIDRLSHQEVSAQLLHVNGHGDALREAYRSRAVGARSEQKAFAIVKPPVLGL